MSLPSPFHSKFWHLKSGSHSPVSTTFICKRLEINFKTSRLDKALPQNQSSLSALLLSVHFSLFFLPFSFLHFPFLFSCFIFSFPLSISSFPPTILSFLSLPHGDRIFPPLEQLPWPQVTSFNQELPLDVAKHLNGKWRH